MLEDPADRGRVREGGDDGFMMHLFLKNLVRAVDLLVAADLPSRAFGVFFRRSTVAWSNQCVRPEPPLARLRNRPRLTQLCTAVTVPSAAG